MPRDQQEAWAASFDSKQSAEQVKGERAHALGTDDHFFWMPMGAEDLSGCRAPGNSLMLPNDNHSQVGNWKIPLSHFQSVFGTRPGLADGSDRPPPQSTGPRWSFRRRGAGSVPIARVSFWVTNACRWPNSRFKREIRTPLGSIEPWREVVAAHANGSWRAEIPAPAEGEQIVAYAMEADANGNLVSSDTVEVPEYPQWRADV